VASAVSEDAYLHTAKRIIALWPGENHRLPRKLRVDLGRHKYEVEVEFTGFMAADCDDRARDAESLVARPMTENKWSPPSTPKEPIEALTLSIKDAGRLLGVGRSTIYRLVSDRQLETVKIGNRTLIKTASIRRLVESD
jgi:excisionase family DNA binding protein